MPRCKEMHVLVIALWNHLGILYMWNASFYANRKYVDFAIWNQGGKFKIETLTLNDC